MAGRLRHSIEFKAIGLSDEETEFCQKMAPLLPPLLPRQGILTLHVEDTSTTVNLNRDERRRQKLGAERRAKKVHPAARPIAASVIVGHGTEQSYLRRLSDRFTMALAQLSPQEGAWVAFHWSNGAPTSMVTRALAAIDVPEHLAGVILLGSVAIPGTLDSFTALCPAPFSGDGTGETDWHSDRSAEEAETLFGIIEASAGVRASYVRVPWRDKWFDFIHRTGDRRILPYNLLLVPDPPDLLPPRDPHGSIGS